jgi:hypothetical protein
LSDEFIENESTPWWTLTVVLFTLTRRISWQGGMKGFDGLSESGHCEITDQIERNRLSEVGFSQGIPDRRPQRRLTNPSNRRVNRSQSVGQWRPFLIATNGRMDHFKTKQAPANQSVG